ncbi:MAG: ABC transporter permease subunit [Acidobacteriota bacterium]|nr:ABC transporter permease subunit [Acidobacteriota bacterium]
MTKKSEIYAQGYEPWEGERGPTDPIDKIFRHPAVLIGRGTLRNVSFMPSGCFLRLGFFILVILPIAGYFFMVAISSIARFQIENLKNSETFGDIARPLAELWAQTSSETTEAQIHLATILIPSLTFSVFAMIFYGSQLISREKQANALQVYFAKAITRADYVIGKFMVIGVLTGLFTLVPSALIILLGLVLSPDFVEFISQSWYVPILTGSYWLVLTASFGSITLFFSACFDKSYMAAVGFIGFGFFCMVSSIVLGALFGMPDILTGLNWGKGIYDIATAIFELQIDFGSRLFWQLVDLGAITLLGIFLLFKKIQPVEVIK